MTIREISPSLIKYIASNDLKVLRRKKDDVALNVSYTISGLKYTANKLGRAIMYKRAFISNGVITFPKTLDGKVDDSLSPNIYVEHFVPRNHSTEFAQEAEYTWVLKALRLLY